jgi:hypothetical protein
VYHNYRYTGLEGREFSLNKDNGTQEDIFED